MHDAAFLHIRSRDGRATRVVALTGPSVRIGRGRACEVRLDDPALAEVECLLRRRGDSWHLQPVCPSGRLTLDGRPADRPRPLPMGSTLRMADRWLTLLPTRDAPDPGPEPEPAPGPAVIELDAQDHARRAEADPDHPDGAGAGRAAEQPTAATEANAEPLEARRAELARLEARLRQRERWLKDRLQERQWEARWRAAGASLKNRARPEGGAPGPRPRPSSAPLRPAVPPEPSLRARREAVPPSAPRYDRPTPAEVPASVAPPIARQAPPIARQAPTPPAEPMIPEIGPSIEALLPGPSTADPSPLPTEASRSLRLTEPVVPVEELLGTAGLVGEAGPEVEGSADLARPESVESVAVLDLRAEDIAAIPVPEPVDPEPVAAEGVEAPAGTVPVEPVAVGILSAPERPEARSGTEQGDGPDAEAAMIRAVPEEVEARAIDVGASIDPTDRIELAGHRGEAGPDPAVIAEQEESAGATDSAPDEGAAAEGGDRGTLPLPRVEMPELGRPRPVGPEVSPEAIDDRDGAEPEASGEGSRIRLTLPTIGLNDLVSMLSLKGRPKVEREGGATSAGAASAEEAAGEVAWGRGTADGGGPDRVAVEAGRPDAEGPGSGPCPTDAAIEAVEAESPTSASDAGPVGEVDDRVVEGGPDRGAWREPEEEPEPPVLRSGEWPSAKAILGAQPEGTRRKAAARRRATASLPVPSDRIAPDEWTVPGGAWLCIPLLFVVLAVGVVGVRVAWTWAVIDRESGRLADQLAGGRRPEGVALELALEREQELPAASWRNSTADQMIVRAALRSGAGRGFDPAAEERVGELLHAAAAGAPGHPSLRFARAWRAVQEPGDDPPAAALGLSRDVWPLAWTGRALLARGKLEEAKRAYRSALDLACRSRPDPTARPTFHGEGRGGRFGLPLEEVIGVVLSDMAGRPEWGTEDWEEVLPEFAGAWLVAARLLRQRGDPAADRALERAVALGDGPAPAGCSPALHEAAAAEALALLGRFEESAERYRAAVARLSPAEESARRPWMFNLAELCGRLGDARGERSCLLAAMITDPNDPVTSEAIRTQLRRGVSLVGVEGDEPGVGPAGSARSSRTRTLGE